MENEASSVGKNIVVIVARRVDPESDYSYPNNLLSLLRAGTVVGSIVNL